ncbi:hypothetical protein Cantr_02512 [Candida viswanathii]|uniref:Uncharacterized protein n=1 Tax=Candida viswanathii TaxID=5486 RepID=A0A367YP66_9ASCO|nr:hypothetical protein Cantr_02512 [Candida viswanathii]
MIINQLLSLTVSLAPVLGYIHRNLTWNDINFLHTTDTHGWYLGHINQPLYHAHWGDFISFSSHLRAIADSQGQDLIIVDSGDRHDGNGFSDITTPNGVKSIPVFVRQDYDLLTIGNHELYEWANSEMEYNVVVEHFGGKYVCSNVEINVPGKGWVAFGEKYRYFETKNQGARVLSFGFLFDFKRFNDGTRVTPMSEVIEQEWFNEVLREYDEDKVDVIVIVGHTPVSHSWKEFYQVHSYLRRFYPNTIIQYFGGHSHIRDFSVFDDLSTGLQSGRYCETIGWSSVNLTKERLPVRERFSRSYIDFNLDSFKYHTGKYKDFDTKTGKDVARIIKDTRKELKLDKLIGYVEKNYYVDYVPISHPHSIFNLLTTKILKTLPGGDNENRIIIINTGSIRYDLYKGPYTVDSKYIVSPFENVWVNLTIPKRIAVKVADKLNKADYISTSRLKPPHQYDLQDADFQINSKQFFFSNNKLPKGYVTHDDFGIDGDDTLHKAVVNFPVPNVVQSVEVKDGDLYDEETPVNLIFYTFITPNILWALGELNYTLTDANNTPTFYSDVYLGTLLNEYVSSNKII